MNLSFSAPAKQAMRRIRHRLEYQHVRWIATQPIKDQFWFRTCRKFRRVTRWFAIHVDAVCNKAADWLKNHATIASTFYVAAIIVALLLFSAAVIVALGLVTVGPSEVLQWNPDRRPLRGSDEVAAVALTRLTIIVSLVAPFLWCILPGSDRNVLLRSGGNKQGIRSLSFLRKPPASQAVSVRYLLPVMAVIASLAVVSAAGIFARLSHPLFAMIAGGVFFVAAAWTAYRVGLRMMRKRSAVIWHMSAYEWIAMGIAVAGLSSLILLAKPEIVSVSQYLRWLGPVGYAMANLQSVATGNYLALLPVLLVCMLMVAFGWWAGKDAGTWANRRKLVSSRRLLNRAEVNHVATTPKNDTDCLKQIQSGLNQAVESRQLRSRGFLIRPFWLRRRHNWYWIIAGCMSILVIAFAVVKFEMDQYEQIAVIGYEQNSPETQLTRMFGMPFVFVLLCTEIMALFDKAIAVPVSFLERPLSSWQYFWRVHRAGIARLPVQLLLSLPFFALLFLADPTGINGDLPTLTTCVGMLVASVAFLLTIRSLFASFHVLQSIRSITNRLFAEASQVGLAVLAFATLLYILGSATVAAGEIRLATYLLTALGINLFMLLVFAVIAVIRGRFEHASG